MSDKSELLKQVEIAIDSIRPYLKTDGGDVKVLGISDDNVVEIELLGSCGTCPMSPMTLKNGVEEAVKKSVPQIKSVHAINLTQPQD